MYLSFSEIASLAPAPLYKGHAMMADLLSQSCPQIHQLDSVSRSSSSNDLFPSSWQIPYLSPAMPCSESPVLWHNVSATPALPLASLSLYTLESFIMLSYSRTVGLSPDSSSNLSYSPCLEFSRALYSLCTMWLVSPPPSSLTMGRTGCLTHQPSLFSALPVGGKVLLLPPP